MVVQVLLVLVLVLVLLVLLVLVLLVVKVIVFVVIMDQVVLTAQRIHCWYLESKVNSLVAQANQPGRLVL
jgi:hypothetical protein